MTTAKKVLFAVLLLLACPLWARTKLQGIVERGGQSVVVNGVSSSTRSIRTFPGATITICTSGVSSACNGGSGNLVATYSNATGTVLSNPFHADTAAAWFVYLDDGTYDILFSPPSFAAWSLSAIVVGGTCPAGVTCVDAQATAGLGTLASPWTGWETAINALPTSSSILFRSGNYTQTARIDVKDRWKISGAGRGATVITSTFTGTSFRLNTVPSPALGYVSLSDLSIVNTNAANTGSGVLSVGCFTCSIDRVRITGFRYGLTHINSEVFSVRDSTIEFQKRANEWVVNNGDYNLTYADLDYSSYGGGGTNAISHYDVQYNGVGTLGPMVIDDGGYNHAWYSCNFNAGTNAFRFAGVIQAICISADFEGQSNDLVVGAATSYNSGAGVGPSGSINFQSNMMTQGDGVHAIVNVGTGIQTLKMDTNTLNTPIAAIKTASATNLYAIRSVMNNGPLTDSTPASGMDCGSNNASNACTFWQPITTTSTSSAASYAPTATAFAALGTPANGTVKFCSDCNATCTAGGGTGRTCFRENGVWTH